MPSYVVWPSGYATSSLAKAKKEARELGRGAYVENTETEKLVFKMNPKAKPARRTGLQGFPAGKWLKVAGHSRVRAVKINKNGTVDAKILDRSAKRNVAPKKRAAKKATNKTKAKAKSRKNPLSRVDRVDLRKRIAKATKAGRDYARKQARVDSAYTYPVHPEVIARQAGWEIGGQGADWQRQVREAFMTGYRSIKKSKTPGKRTNKLPTKRATNKKRAAKKKPARKNSRKKVLKIGSKAWVKKMARARAKARRAA